MLKSRAAIRNKTSQLLLNLRGP